MSKKKNLFERETYTRRAFRWDIFKQKCEEFYEIIGTPSFIALVIYISIILFISIVVSYFESIRLVLIQAFQVYTTKLNIFTTAVQDTELRIVAPVVNIRSQKIPVEYSEISYIPSLIAGISTFGFALLFFVAEFVRDKGSHPYARSIIQKTLIFPLVISSIASFMVLVFFPRHPYLLGILCLYLGLMALVSTFYLFRWIWTKNEVHEGGGIPAVQAIYRLFLHEIRYANKKPSRFNFINTWKKKKISKRKLETEKSIQEFVDGLLTYQSPRDDEYMVYLGRMLVHIRYILVDNNFIISNSTTVPSLVAPYLQTLLFHDADITKLILKDKVWIRRAAYLAITNAELALEVGDKNAMSHSVSMVTALYGVLHEKPALRDFFLDLILRWVNEFADFYVEKKLFKIPKDINEFRKILELSEIVFDSYTGLLYNTYDSGISEKNPKNFKEVLSGFSEVYDDFLRGRFSGDRNIEREAEHAIYCLKHPDFAKKTLDEYLLDIQINNERKALLLKKRGVLACLGAIFFHEMFGNRQNEKEAAHIYYELIFNSLVVSVESLIPLYLSFPEEFDDKFGLDTYLRPKKISRKPEAYSVPNIIYDLSPGAIVNILLERKDLEIPEKLASFDVQSFHSYPAEKMVEVLEKILSDNPPIWSKNLPRGYKKKAEQLVLLLQSVKSEADEKKKDEIRNTPMPPNSEDEFKKSTLLAFSKKSNCLKIFTQWGLKIYNKTNETYKGKINRYGITTWMEKRHMLDLTSIEYTGKRYGENMADEEGSYLLRNLLKQLKKETVSVASLIRRISKLNPSKTLIVTEHYYWFDTLLNSKKLQKYIAMPDARDVNFEKYGDVFRGYFVVKNKKYPVIGLHERSLERRLMLFKQSDIGELHYYSAEPYGEPLRDSSTAPLLVTLTGFANDEKTKKLAKRKTILTDISSREEKAKRLRELLSVQILFRLSVKPNKKAIALYSLSLRGKIARRKKQKKK